MISGYSKWWKFNEALDLLSSMHRCDDVKFNESTFSTALSLCGRLQSLSLGKQVHCLVIKSGSSLLYSYANCFEIEEAKRVFQELHDKNELLWNLMIVGYVESGLMKEALDMFMKMPKRDVVAWTTLISGYVKSEEGCEKALELFWWMRGSSEVVPNEFTLDSVIRACSRIYDGVTNPCLNASNSLIRGHISMGKIEDAELVFNRLVEANLVSYNLMIKGSGEIDKALKLFEETQGERNSITSSTYKVNILGSLSCMFMPEISSARKITSCTLAPFQSNVYVGTSLMDMYSKCGSIVDAHKSFSSISSLNVAAWTAISNGYAHHGLGSQGISLFEHMLEKGVVPNGSTFVGILSACAHSGLVNEGMKLFRSMEKCYSVIPTIENYACVVDLLGRAGLLQKAEEFIKRMLVEADEVVWGALLHSCWYWMDMEVGERVAEKLFSMNPKTISVYVFLSYIFAILGKWGEKLENEQQGITILTAIASFSVMLELLKGTHRGGIGVVLRDVKGFVVGAAAIVLSNILDAHLADAVAAREGIVFVPSKKMGMHAVILEWDSLSVVKK
ncbi:bidirectional sugar transporter SWEET3-like [Hibiscus syriacus]|uniref:Bidirectional sugar transporter SWEET3-like n=1 Tax=Hibiscus syriacus TaxID=106335 RepID=A0A6A3CGW2_HIBSY|nr:bidirectional sugar transporter SWEET3-like [Hibiscus syriacus]